MRTDHLQESRKFTISTLKVIDAIATENVTQCLVHDT